MKKILLMFTLLLSVVLLSSCVDKNGVFEVTFKDYNGEVLKTEEVKYKNSATPPLNPTRRGYKFLKWNRSFENVRKNLTIEAVYELNYHEKYFDLMHATIDIKFYGGEDEDLDYLYDLFLLYTQISSNYKRNEVRPGSPYYNLENVYSINENRGVKPVKVVDELFELIKFAYNLIEDTNGYFNPFIGNAVNIWKQVIDKEMFPEIDQSHPNYRITKAFARGGIIYFNIEGHNPDKDLEITSIELYKGNTFVKEIDKNRFPEIDLTVNNFYFSQLEKGQEYQVRLTYKDKNTNEVFTDKATIKTGDDVISKELYEAAINEINKLEKNLDLSKVVLDEENKTVFLKDDSLLLDLGAVAKGYVTNLAVNYLVEKGIKYYMVNSGSSNIGVGTHIEDRAYKIGNKDPVGIYQNDRLGILEKLDTHIVTSGYEEQYVTYEGSIYHHIVSPIDYLPKDNFLSVIIVGADAGLLDAYSTAVFSMSTEEAIRFLESKSLEYVLYENHSYKIITNIPEPYYKVSKKK